MPQVNCPSCRRALNVPDAMVGQQVRCPLCNHVFQASGQADLPPPPPASYSPPPERAPAARDDYDRPGGWSPREPSRPGRPDDADDRGYDDLPPLTTPDRGIGGTVWMVVAGAFDLLVLVAFFVFVLTVDNRPPPAYVFLMFALLALVFYVAPIVFFFVAAAVMRSPRGDGLIITGSVMAFIVAVELLILAVIFGIGMMVALDSPMRRMPAMVPVMFVLSIVGVALTITAGVRALVALGRPASRPPSGYY
jgi:LSD1 subclass zinc finger protein